MNRELEDMVLRPQTHQPCGEQRSTFERDEPASFGLQERLELVGRAVRRAEVQQRNFWVERGANELFRASPDRGKRRSQDFVATNQLGDRALERADVQAAFEAESYGNVVRVTPRNELIEVPETLLGRGERGFVRELPSNHARDRRLRRVVPTALPSFEKGPPERGHFIEACGGFAVGHVRGDYVRTASRIERICPSRGMTRVSSNPAAVKSWRNSCSVRSRPPLVRSRSCRSKNLFGSGPLPG